MATEERHFFKGMDFDSEERFIQDGYTRKNINVRMGTPESNSTGVAFNVLGNTLIPNVDLPSGENIVIGSHWYESRDLNYYFVYNENGDHGIYEYNHVSSKITKVVISSVLNFSKDNLITGINVVELDFENDLLYWVDDINPPRKINIQKAKSGAYTAITEQVIDAIKYPPLYPPICEFKNDGTRNINLLDEKIYQVKARYIYDDKEVSAFSPISLPVLPAGEFGNYIEIKVPIGSQEVTQLELAIRLGNNSDFVSIIKQKVNRFTISGNYYVYNFYNDKTYNVISLPESNKLFDSIPRIARTQEYTKDRLFYGNILEGYDNVDVDTSIDISFEDVVEPNKNTIMGTLSIMNPFVLDDKYDTYQPIYQDSNGNIVWGGYDNALSVGNPTQFRQSLPLGGFVVYLAGTDYYAITKQIPCGTPSLQDPNTGVYTTQDKGRIRDQVEASSNSSLDYYGENRGSRVWSYFEFNDVPDGEYVLRVASHKTTQSDLLSPDRRYQKTSTNTVRVNGVNGATETTVVVSGGQIVHLRRTEIADLVEAGRLNPKDVHTLTGYLTDSDNLTDDTVSSFLDSSRITNAYALYAYSGIPTMNSRGDSLIKINYNSYSTSELGVKSDHNGYFFLINEDSLPALSGCFVGAYKSSSYSYYNITDSGDPATPNPSLGSGKTAEIVVRNLSNNIKDYSRDEALITVLDSSGNVVPDAAVAIGGGETYYTDSQGVALCKIYAYTPSQSGASSFTQTSFRIYTTDFSTSSPAIQYYAEYIGKGFRNELEKDPLTYPDFILTFLFQPGKSYLRRGGSYQYGIVYYDRANRSGLTNTDDNMKIYVPYYTEEVGGTLYSSAPSVSWEIRNYAPSWATHYQWVRTKDMSVNSYIQWASEQINITDTTIEIDMTNLSSDYADAYPSMVLTNDFKAGDKMLLIGESNGNRFDKFYSLRVLSQQAGIVTVEKPSDLPPVNNGLWFEILSPKLLEDNYIYYEIGEVYDVIQTVDGSGNTVYIHQGQTQDQSGSNPVGTPATGVFGSGDAYYRQRNIPLTSGIFQARVNSAYFSDFYESKISDIGRPNIVDSEYGEVWRPTTIYYSQKFIPETNINGLNSFFDISFEAYNRRFGGIRKLFAYQDRLDCIQEQRTSKILVEENVIYDQFDKGTVGASEKVLSNAMYYEGNYGTLNPESFSFNDGRRYFFDIINGKVLRLSTDGFTPISDNLMHSYFESKSNFYSVFNIIPKVWGVYDEMNSEYVLSFGEASRPEGFTPDDLALVSSQADTIREVRDGLEYTFYITYSQNTDGVETVFTVIRDIQNGTYIIQSNAADITLDRQRLLAVPQEVISFSEETKSWVTFYTFNPQCMGRVGIMFLSFSNGRAFLHNTNKTRNNFYGVSDPSEIWVAFNQEPDKVKVFNNIAEESDGIWYADEIVTQGGQKTSLTVEDFQDDQGQGLVFTNKETIHYAHLWQDENTQNVDNPLFEGDDMRDTSILVKLKNDDTNEQRVFSVKMNYTLSYRSI